MFKKTVKSPKGVMLPFGKAPLNCAQRHAALRLLNEVMLTGAGFARLTQ